MKIYLIVIIMLVSMLNYHESQAQFIIKKDVKKLSLDSSSIDVKSRIGTFIGIVSKLDAEITNVWSFGFNYSYRLDIISRRLEVGIFGDYIADTYGEFAFGVPITYNLGSGLRFSVAPGGAMLKTPIPGVEITENTKDLKYKVNFLTRLGVNYSFYLDELFISPKVHIDLINGRTFTGAGVNFGFVFY